MIFLPCIRHDIDIFIVDVILTDELTHDRGEYLQVDVESWIIGHFPDIEEHVRLSRREVEI